MKKVIALSSIFLSVLIYLHSGHEQKTHPIPNNKSERITTSDQEPLAISIVKSPYIRANRCEFTIEPLKTLKFKYSEATDINDKGEIVGIFYDDDNKKYSAFLSTADGEIQSLELPGGEVHTIRINNASQIAGTIHFGETDDRFKGFILDPQSGLTIIEGLGGVDTVVRDLNDLGQVVGYSHTGEKSEYSNQLVKHAFIWENGEIKDLGTLKSDLDLDGDMSEAIAINNHCEIVGMSNYSINAGGVKKIAISKPFYWNGKMQEIPCGSTPIAINNKSNVILNGNNQTLLWNPYNNIAYSIPHTPAADINDNDMVLFSNSCLTDPKSSFSDEVVFYINGSLRRGTTCINANKTFSFAHHVIFKKINNNNFAIGQGTVECLNEKHALVLKPL